MRETSTLCSSRGTTGVRRRDYFGFCFLLSDGRVLKSVYSLYILCCPAAGGVRSWIRRRF